MKLQGSSWVSAVVPLALEAESPERVISYKKSWLVSRGKEWGGYRHGGMTQMKGDTESPKFWLWALLNSQRVLGPPSFIHA